MYWMRSGGLKSKQHQVMAWAGDQTVDWTKYYKLRQNKQTNKQIETKQLTGLSITKLEEQLIFPHHLKVSFLSLLHSSVYILTHMPGHFDL